MPYIKREELDRLTSAGSRMSNVCFNWKQTAYRVTLTDAERKQLGELQEEWDAALRAISANRSKR
jgi:hypothetical protein